MSDGELWELLGRNLETLLGTLLGTRVSLADEQVLGSLAAMDAGQRHVVLLRCAGLTARGVAARDGMTPSQVHEFTITGLRQAIGRLWPDSYPIHPQTGPAVEDLL